MTDRDIQKDRLKKLLKEADESASNKLIMDYDDAIDDNADYLLANDVIVPPCKVGDSVWLVFTPKYPANRNDYGKWFMRQDGVQRIILGKKGLSIETWNMGTIPAKELGKKLFLTKEEAEEKLRELGK